MLLVLPQGNSEVLVFKSILLFKEAELVETLQGEGPFTVFAPDNAAFEKLLGN